MTSRIDTEAHAYSGKVIEKVRLGLVYPNIRVRQVRKLMDSAYKAGYKAACKDFLV